MKRFLLVSLLIISFSYSPVSKAETLPPTLPTDLNSIFSIIEGMVLQGGLPSAIAIGGCMPGFGLAGFKIELKFTSSATCPMSGTIDFGLFPMSANVRLDISNNPILSKLDADITMSLKRDSSGNRVFHWLLTNGEVDFRMMPSAPSMTWAMSGEGTRVKNSTSLQVNSRINFFDKATGSGKAILRTVSQTKPNPAVKSVQSCDATGMTNDNVQSGTLGACVVLK